MINLGNAYGEIQIGTDQAEKNVKGLAAQMADVGQTLKLSVSAPLLGVAAAAVTSAMGFEQNMNMLQAASEATADQMATLQAQALQLGAETSFSAGEAAEAMLELSKAGLEPVEVMDSVAGVMDLAAAGGLGLAQAAEITANALNAFNLPASESGHIANLLAAAANASSVEVTDLEQSLKMTAAVAHQFGLSIDETTTFLAMMGDAGLKGSDAGTSLKTALMRLMAPTADAAGLMAELGINVYDASGAMRPGVDIMKDLQQALYGAHTEMGYANELTAEQQKELDRLTGIVSKTQQKINDYRAGITGMNDSQETANKKLAAWQAELANAQGAQQRLIALRGEATAVTRTLTEAERNDAMAMLFGSDAIRAMSILLPNFTESYQEKAAATSNDTAAAEMADARMRGLAGAIEYLKGAIDSFLIGAALPFLNSFGDIVRMVADAISSFGSLPQPVINAALAFLGVLAAAGPVMLALSGIGTVLGALLSPLGLVVLAVAGLAAAFTSDFMGIRTQTLAAWGAIQPTLQELGTWLSVTIPVGLTLLQSWWSSTWTAINATLQTLWTPLVVILQNMTTWLQSTLPVALAVTQAWFAQAWLTISTAIQSAWSTISAALTTLHGWLQTNIPGALSTLQSAFTTAWNDLPSILSTAWSTIQPVFQQLWTWLQVNLPVAVSALQLWFSAAWGAISTTLQTVWANAGPLLTEWITWLQTNLPQALTVLRDGFSTAWSAVNTAISTAWNATGPVFTQIWTWLQFTLPMALMALQGWFSAAWSTIPGSVSSASSALFIIFEALRSAWARVADFFGPSLGRLASAFGEFFTGLSPLFNQFTELWQALQPAISVAMNAVMTTLGSALAGLSVMWVTAVNFLAATFENLAPLLGIVVDQITNVFNTLNGIVSNMVTLVAAIINGDWATAWQAAKDIVNTLLTFVQSSLGNLLATVGLIFAIIGSTISNTLADLGFTGAAAAVQTVIDKISDLLTWLGKLVTGDVELGFTAPEWITDLVDWLWPTFPEMPDWVESLLDWLWPDEPDQPDWVDDLFDWAWPDFIPQPEWVKTLVSWLWPSFITQPEWIRTLFDWLWPTFPEMPDWVESLLDWLWPDFIEVPGWVENLVDWEWPTFTMPDWIQTLQDLVDKLSGLLDVIPGFAGGSSYTRGGLTALNERGRELVALPAEQSFLPAGSQVYTNGQSNRMLAGAIGGGDIHLHFDGGVVINSDEDTAAWAWKLGNYVRRELGR